jgi:hypothetical protein
MSVSSSKMAVTCEKPNFEIERTSVRPGSPRWPARRGRDLPLDLERRERGRRGVDLHLHRRRVGEGVEGQLHEAGDAERREDHRREQHDRAVSAGRDR